MSFLISAYLCATYILPSPFLTTFCSPPEAGNQQRGTLFELNVTLALVSISLANTKMNGMDSWAPSFVLDILYV